jgi:hypothetical protein
MPLTMRMFRPDHGNVVGFFVCDPVPTSRIDPATRLFEAL